MCCRQYHITTSKEEILKDIGHHQKRMEYVSMVDELNIMRTYAKNLRRLKQNKVIFEKG